MLNVIEVSQPSEFNATANTSNSTQLVAFCNFKKKMHNLFILNTLVVPSFYDRKKNSVNRGPKRQTRVDDCRQLLESVTCF